MVKWKNRGFKLAIVVILALLVLPHIAWRFSDYRELSVLIIDKTVPDHTYREHNRIIYALNHYKYRTRDYENYRAEQDYVGFVPLKDKAYEIRDVLDGLKEDQDLIYLADTYGVYEEEFWGESFLGDRSQQIYGGLQAEEVELIKKQVYENQTPVVAEFNTFGSPTSREVEASITELLGVEWTGWIGRYFDELDSSSNDEIPAWVVKSYELSNGEEWNFAGSGFVLSNREDQVIVLEEGLHFKGDGLEVVFTEPGKYAFPNAKNSQYDYWFDIVETREAESYADYKWNLTDEGSGILKDRGISENFPAITKRYLNQTPLYYFAGDFADTQNTSSIYRYRWLSQLISRSYSLRRNDGDAFQWQAYLPVMESILEEAYELKHRSDSVSRTLFEEDGLRYGSRVSEKEFHLYEDGEWKEKFLKGVNIGAGKPGYFPGDLAITKREYLRWFQQISDMNADVIRVYTTLKPDFYNALLEFNSKAEKPLYLIQGVWVKEEDKEELMDGYADNQRIKNSFIKDSTDLVDIIHGNATLPERPGFANGEYYSDVSDYVIGWILGIEWDPFFVIETNENNPQKTQHLGEYVSAKDAPPFEVLMAEVSDAVLKYEAEEYGMMRPISISNWPTTDMLEHPNEPSPEEDLAEFNMEHLIPTEKNKTGLFASYHIYPYYPEFMNYGVEYREFVDDDGEANAYRGYLRDLLSQHTMPVMVAEFGVPASRGKTHDDVNSGFNQGFHDESEQGRIVASLLEDIYDEGYCGALLFTWQDEWFKRTWNTMDLNLPDRRPFWSDIQTNEQKFGLLSFDPGEGESISYVDGDISEWDSDDILIEDDEMSLSIKSDERYMYLMLKSDSLDLESKSIYIPIDSIREQGNSLAREFSLNFEKQADFLIELKGKENSRILVDAYYDSHYYVYGEQLGMIPQNLDFRKKNSGLFNPMRLCLSKEFYLPQDKKTIPFSDYETGKLKHGNGNPTSKDYNSLADFSVGENNIEVRIPWQLLNVMDPSTKSVMDDFYFRDKIMARETNGFYIGKVALSEESTKQGIEIPMNFYTWDKWETPTYHERLKRSYFVVKDAFEKVESDR